MRIVVEMRNLTKKRICFDFVKKVIKETVIRSRADLNLLEVSVVFVSASEMRKINRKFRKKNESTDILSFRYKLGYNKNNKTLEGELVLCPQCIGKNARAGKVKFDRELAFVVAHGILHLLGWRHGKKMFMLQDKIAAS